jgi:hypothetical protein
MLTFPPIPRREMHSIAPKRAYILPRLTYSRNSYMNQNLFFRKFGSRSTRLSNPLLVLFTFQQRVLEDVA